MTRSELDLIVWVNARDIIERRLDQKIWLIGHFALDTYISCNVYDQICEVRESDFSNSIRRVMFS